MADRLQRGFLPLLVTLCCAMLTGCSKEPVRVPVDGSVTLDGRPLNNALIMFVPVSADGNKSGGAIINGKYAITAENGLIPGEYRVEVIPYLTPKFGGDSPHGGKAETTQPAPVVPDIPDRYNAKTILKAQVSEDVKTFSFLLTSRPTP